jgi:hypothetical protein
VQWNEQFSFETWINKWPGTQQQASVNVGNPKIEPHRDIIRQPLNIGSAWTNFIECLERALKVDRRVPIRPARDDAVSEDLADRLLKPLRDFERAALFDLAQDPSNSGGSTSAMGRAPISGNTSASRRVTTWSWWRAGGPRALRNPE